MKVTLNELISNRFDCSSFSWDENTKTFSAVYKGFWYQTELCYPYTSDDITDNELLEEIHENTDNFQDFKEELQSYLSAGFNDYTDAHSAENYFGADFAFIEGKGYLYDTMDEDGYRFTFPDEDNTKDMFQCEVITPENSVITVYVKFPTYNPKPDVEYEVEVELGDDWEDNPGNYCDFGVFISDKCYYKLWRRYLTLTGKDL